MTEVLANIPNADLQCYAVWLPILNEDSRATAQQDAQIFDDPRLHHYWDGIATQGTVWNRRLELPPGQIAWNLFAVFPRGVRWENDPPEPIYWAHNLNVDIGIKYNALELRHEIEKALAMAAPKPDAAAPSTPPAP